MGYPSNGINHHNAISSEKNITKYIKRFEMFYNKKIKDIAQLGGTKNKTDYTIQFSDGTKSNHSLKSKKNIKSGSFDYVNTTLGVLSKYMEETLNIYKTYRGSQDLKNYELLKKSISDEIKGSLSSEIITQFFLDNVIKKYQENDLTLTIEDQLTNTLYINVIPKIFEFVINGGNLIIRNRGEKVSMSYIIDGISPDGSLITDFGLRLRIHLNNGSTKWLNGENSTIVAKFQQDMVHKLI